MSYKRIVGIDQSLNSTGVAIIDNESGELLHSESIILNTTVNNKLKGTERLIFIRDRVQELIREFEGDFVVLEGYSFGSRGASIFNLGEVGGALRILLHDMGLPFETVPPKTLKKYIASNGNADKEMMARAIFERFRFTFTSSDEADAYGLAQMAKDIGPENLKTFCYPEKKKKEKKPKAQKESKVKKAKRIKKGA